MIILEVSFLVMIPTIFQLVTRQVQLNVGGISQDLESNTFVVMGVLVFEEVVDVIMCDHWEATEYVYAHIYLYIYIHKYVDICIINWPKVSENISEDAIILLGFEGASGPALGMRPDAISPNDVCQLLVGLMLVQTGRHWIGNNTFFKW